MRSRLQDGIFETSPLCRLCRTNGTAFRSAPGPGAEPIPMHSQNRVGYATTGAPLRATSATQGLRVSIFQRLQTLGIQLRKRAPQSLRRAKRLARLALASVEPSEPLPPDLLSACKMCASREDLVCLLPRGARVAEIGVDTGGFSQHILSASEPAELHLVDIDFTNIDPAVLDDPRVTAHRDYSHEALARFADASFDWIYIDADHSYEGCARDAVAAAPKVKPGGFLVFNDFAHLDTKLGVYGVHRAVTKFARDYRWPFAFWAYQVDGLYDVALKKPV